MQIHVKFITSKFLILSFQLTFGSGIGENILAQIDCVWHGDHIQCLVNFSCFGQQENKLMSVNGDVC